MNIHIQNKQGNKQVIKKKTKKEKDVAQVYSLDLKTEKENQTKEIYDWPEPKKNWQLLWDEWIDFRKREGKPKFKSIKSENIAKNKLVKDANGNLKIAVEMVENSISSNYQGLFKTKNTKNAITKKQLWDLAGFDD